MTCRPGRRRGSTLSVIETSGFAVPHGDRRAGEVLMLWRIAQIAAWPPITYCLFAMALTAKWMIWFPIMVLRHGLHGAIDAAVAGRADVAQSRARDKPPWLPRSGADNADAEPLGLFRRVPWGPTSAQPSSTGSTSARLTSPVPTFAGPLSGYRRQTCGLPLHHPAQPTRPRALDVDDLRLGGHGRHHDALAPPLRPWRMDDRRADRGCGFRFRGGRL